MALSRVTLKNDNDKIADARESLIQLSLMETRSFIAGNTTGFTQSKVCQSLDAMKTKAPNPVPPLQHRIWRGTFNDDQLLSMS